MELKPIKMGLAMGIVCSVAVILIAIMAAFDYGVPMLELISSFYIGYSATFLGAIIGAVYGFIDGFIFGFALIWLYNKII